VRRALPSPLRRRWLVAWWTVFARSLAATGLLLATVLAAAAQRGPVCLAFLTATSVLAVAVVRARRQTRVAAAALRFHVAVEGALHRLALRGWHLNHDVRWPAGRGDGHVATIPAGELGFAIRDCLGGADDFDLAQAQELATSLGEAGQPHIPICVTAETGAEPVSNRGVICCTPERLATELLDAEKAFGASLLDEAMQCELLYSAPEA